MTSYVKTNAAGQYVISVLDFPEATRRCEGNWDEVKTETASVVTAPGNMIKDNRMSGNPDELLVVTKTVSVMPEQDGQRLSGDREHPSQSEECFLTEAAS